MPTTPTLHGIGASPGVAVGQAWVLRPSRPRTPKLKLPPGAIDAEVLRFKAAVEASDAQLGQLKGRLAGSDGDGGEHDLILEAHRMMLRDPMFIVEVGRHIRDDGINAELAVRRVCKQLRRQFDAIADDYFRERRRDVDFIGDRLVRTLLGEEADPDIEVPHGAVIVAHDVSPAQASMLLRGGRVAAFVTAVGSHTSHTAIIARARETPAVVGVPKAFDAIRTGDTLAVDGGSGLVLVNPGDEALVVLREARRRQQMSDERARSEAAEPAVTLDGVRVQLWGNLEFPEEVPTLLAHGAEGIGLYRTEFLFLERDEPPTEEEHYQAYRQVLEAMGGRPVTIRTLDLGGDKLRGRRGEKENNPAMGLRALRYCLRHREVFRPQLRALLRASAHGDLRVMFPLVSNLSELREARSELERCRSELTREGVPVGPRFPVGIMVETPSAALIADRLAQEADFFSIGTNDLIQYTMAIDRQNREVAYLYRPLHLALLRLLKQVVEAGRAARIPVAMCGEMAGDAGLTLVLLALGLDALSMPAGRVPLVKRAIRALSQADARAVLEQALGFSSAEEIERFVRGEVERRLGDDDV